jgi:uncharacterized membrane protein YcjF (UPF0283 family)
VTTAILFMAFVPVPLLLVLAFVALGDRMSEPMRKRVELGLTLLLYPALILSGALWAWDNYQEADWVGFGMMLALAGMFAIQFVVALRTRTLFPRYGHPKA